MGDVSIVLLGRCNEQGAVAIEASQMLWFFLSPTNGGHVAHPYNLTVEGGDINAADLV